jgi:hypothetical protein
VDVKSHDKESGCYLSGNAEPLKLITQRMTHSEMDSREIGLAAFGDGKGREQLEIRINR